MAVGTSYQPWDPVASLTRYALEQSKPSVREQKGKLAPQEHDALCVEFNEARPLIQRDAPATKENLHGITKKFVEYCTYRTLPSWRGVMRACDKGTVVSFLRFLCEHYRIAKTDTLREYWRQFRMLYDRITGSRLSTEIGKEAWKYIQILEVEFELDPSPKDKPVLGSDDVLLLLTHLWARDTCTFPTEDQRHGLATILLLSIFTGARPAELVDAMKHNAPDKYPWEHPERPDLDGPDSPEDKEDLDALDDEQLGLEQHPDDPDYDRPEPWHNANDTDYEEAAYDEDTGDYTKRKRRYKSLCYEDIRLWIVQNPTPGERDLLAMEIELKHHKGADRKPKPTIYLFREEELPILCPIAHVFAIALRDDAILVENRPDGAQPFFTTRLKDPTKATRVFWKPHMLKVPIFRQAVRTADGFRTSKHKGLRYSAYAYYLDRLGWEAGFEQKLTAYCARRCTGNAVDGATTIAVRDQIMRHDPNSGIFNSAYLNARVRFDIQSAVMERPSADGLTRAFTHMSIRCDPRAPKDVPKHIKDALPRDPKIAQLKEEKSALLADIKCEYRFLYRAKGTTKWKEHRELGQKISRATKKWEEGIKKAYRRQYFYHIHNEELQRQLNNVETAGYVVPVIQHQLTERTRVQEILCSFPHGLSQEDIVRRRIRAIDLMVALCSCREEPLPKPQAASSLESFGVADLGESKEAVPRQPSPKPGPVPLICGKTQCIFFCTGTATNKTFCRPAKMMDHVEAHLRREKAETGSEKVRCRHPVCKSAGLVLEDVHDFKNHVQGMHGVTLRKPWYVRRGSEV